MRLMNCGDERLSRPSLGAWLMYGLGTENQNLPGFVVLTSSGSSRAQRPRRVRSHSARFRRRACRAVIRLQAASKRVVARGAARNAPTVAAAAVPQRWNDKRPLA